MAAIGQGAIEVLVWVAIHVSQHQRVETFVLGHRLGFDEPGGYSEWMGCFGAQHSGHDRTFVPMIKQ